MDRFEAIAGKIAQRSRSAEIERWERVDSIQDDLGLVESWLEFLDHEDNPDPNDLKKAEKYLDDAASDVNMYLGDRKLVDALTKMAAEVRKLRDAVMDMHYEYEAARDKRGRQLASIQAAAKGLTRRLGRYKKLVK